MCCLWGVFLPTRDWKFSREPGCRRGVCVCVGGGDVVGPMCLCTVYGSHRVHLFKNQKHLFLYHQGFSQKLETTKKKCQFQLCTPRLRYLCSVSLQAAAFSPRLGSFSGPHVGKLYPGGSFWTSNLKVDRSFLHIWLWGQGPSRDPVYQQK